MVGLDGYFLGVVNELWPRGLCEDWWRVCWCDGYIEVWLGDLLVFDVAVDVGAEPGLVCVVEWVGDLGVGPGGGSLTRGNPEDYVCADCDVGDHDSVVRAFVDVAGRGGFCG